MPTSNANGSSWPRRRTSSKRPASSALMAVALSASGAVIQVDRGEVAIRRVVMHHSYTGNRRPIRSRARRVFPPRFGDADDRICRDPVDQTPGFAQARAHGHEEPSYVIEREPVVELQAFSSPGAAETPWVQGREQLADAQLYWLTTVRPDGRPHVTPLLGVWSEGGLYFCTGSTERKAKNLSQNANCILTTGRNDLEGGLDVVAEGEAAVVTDDSELDHVAGVFETKYGSRFTAPG